MAMPRRVIVVESDLRRFKDLKRLMPLFDRLRDVATARDKAASLLGEAQAALEASDAPEKYRRRVAFVQDGFDFLRANMALGRARTALEAEPTVDALQRAAEANRRIEKILDVTP